MKKIGFSSGLNAVLPAAYNGWSGELFGCVNDSRVNQAGYAQHGFTMSAMLNEQATLKAFEQAIIDLADQTESGDAVAITNSGHASRYYTPLIGHREYLCLWDGQMADAKFLSLLAKFKPGVRVVVELDVCHASGFSRSAFSESGDPRRTKAMPREVMLAVPEPMFAGLRGDIQSSLILCAACRPEETALDGYGNGIYTESRWKARDQFLEVPTHAEWFAATESLMLQNYPQQHPVAHQLGPDSIWNSQVG